MSEEQNFKSDRNIGFKQSRSSAPLDRSNRFGGTSSSSPLPKTDIYEGELFGPGVGKSNPFGSNPSSSMKLESRSDGNPLYSSSKSFSGSRKDEKYSELLFPHTAESIIPKLAELLRQQESPQLRLAGLELSGEPISADDLKSFEALYAQVDDTESRLTIVNAIGQLGVPALHFLLEVTSTTEGDLQQTAFECLRRICTRGDAGCFEALVAHANDATLNKQAREFALILIANSTKFDLQDNYLSIEHLLNSDDANQRMVGMLALYKPFEPIKNEIQPEKRQQKLEKLTKSDHERIAGYLKQGIQDNDESVKLVTLQAIQSLIEVPPLKSRFGQFRGQKVRLPNSIIPTEEIRALLRTSNSHPAIRQIALEVLPLVHHIDDIPVLIESLKDSDPVLRATAVVSLGTYLHDDVYPALVPLLNDEDLHVRLVTLGVLQEKEKADEAIITALESLVDHPSRQVRGFVLDHPQIQFTDIPKRLLNDPDMVICERAITRLPFDDLFAVFETVPHDNLRETAIRQLFVRYRGQLRKSQPIEALVNTVREVALRDPQEAIRKQALEWLIQEKLTTQELLLTVCLYEGNVDMRIMAFKALESTLPSAQVAKLAIKIMDAPRFKYMPFLQVKKSLLDTLTPALAKNIHDDEAWNLLLDLLQDVSSFHTATKALLDHPDSLSRAEVLPAIFRHLLGRQYINTFEDKLISYTLTHELNEEAIAVLREMLFDESRDEELRSLAVIMLALIPDISSWQRLLTLDIGFMHFRDEEVLKSIEEAREILKSENPVEVLSKTINFEIDDEYVILRSILATISLLSLGKTTTAFSALQRAVDQLWFLEQDMFSHTLLFRLIYATGIEESKAVLADAYYRCIVELGKKSNPRDITDSLMFYIPGISGMLDEQVTTLYLHLFAEPLILEQPKSKPVARNTGRSTQGSTAEQELQDLREYIIIGLALHDFTRLLDIIRRIKDSDADFNGALELIAQHSLEIGVNVDNQAYGELLIELPEAMSQVSDHEIFLFIAEQPDMAQRVVKYFNHTDDLNLKLLYAILLVYGGYWQELPSLVKFYMQFLREVEAVNIKNADDANTLLYRHLEQIEEMLDGANARDVILNALSSLSQPTVDIAEKQLTYLFTEVETIRYISYILALIYLQDVRVLPYFESFLDRILEQAEISERENDVILLRIAVNALYWFENPQAQLVYERLISEKLLSPSTTAVDDNIFMDLHVKLEEAPIEERNLPVADTPKQLAPAEDDKLILRPMTNYKQYPPIDE